MTPLRFVFRLEHPVACFPLELIGANERTKGVCAGPHQELDRHQNYLKPRTRPRILMIANVSTGQQRRWGGELSPTPVVHCTVLSENVGIASVFIFTPKRSLLFRTEWYNLGYDACIRNAYSLHREQDRGPQRMVDRRQRSAYRAPSRMCRCARYFVCPGLVASLEVS